MRLSLYSRCDELPLNRFIECVRSNRTTLLRKHLFVGRKCLRATWLVIMEEYAKLLGDTKYQRTFQLSRDITRDACILTLIELCINVLRAKYSQGCVGVLNKLGYTYKFDKNDSLSYHSDLERVAKKAKMLRVEIEKNRVLYENIISISGDNGKDNFSGTLLILSKYMGYRIDLKTITVTEFIELKNQYDREAKLMESSKHRKKR